jgi:hypothetical protein
MKKGLLSILAGALVVVGCQNYDDQFDQLESQINALASTVAGLSAVQSDLASLAATVNSLSSSIDSSVDTALASGLADIDAAIATLNAAAEAAANNSDVGAIADDVSDIQDDLQTLLASSSVFNGDVTINSVATLDVFHQMGDAIAIVNGNVDIDATSDMDATKLQETIDQILTTVEDFSYEAGSSTAAAPTFNNLTGTRSLTVKIPGDIRFEGLVSAANIYLKDDYKSKTNVIHFGALTSVKKFFTDATANRIAFSKATELHLTSLAYYPPLNLTVVVDEGAAFPNALDDIDADGDQKDITLNITGPASFTSTQILDGSMTFEDVASVTVNGYKGTFDINAGVESFSADMVTVIDLAGASDLETIDITGALDPDNTTDKSGPSITIASNNNISSVDIDGKTDDITLTGNGNLETVIIGAVVDGPIAIGATGSGNSDLVTLTLTGASATGVHVIENYDIETVTIDATMIAGTATGAVIDGDIRVVDNTSLTTLNISSDKVEYLQVTGNDDLETVDFTGLAAAGATGSPEVYIYDNDITGTMDDQDDGNTDVDDGKAGDLGSISSESGIETAATYLKAVAADADTNASVFFDAVDFTSEGDTTTEYLWTTDAATTNQRASILYLKANTADTGDAATTAKRSFVITTGSSFEAYANNADLVGTAVNLDSNNSVAISTQILTSAATTAATAAGVTMTAVDGGNPVAYIAIGPNSTASENSATGAVHATAGTTNVSDTLVLTVEGNSVTVTGTAYTGTDAVANALVAAWAAKYTTSGLERYTISTEVGTTNVGNAEDCVIVFTARDRGTGSLNKAVSLAFTAGKTSTGSNIGIVIGNDASFTKSTADNVTKGDDIVLTFAASTAGSILSEIGYFGKTQADAAKNVSLAGGTYTELSSTYTPNAAVTNGNTSINVYAHESRRNDVVLPEEPNAAATSNAVSYNRTGWFS